MEFVNRILEVLVWLWAFWQTQFLVIHIGANLIVALAAAIYTGEFVLAKVGQFLYKKVLPFVLIFGFCAGLGEAAGLEWLATVAWAALEANLLGDLADNLAKLGLPMPDALTKKNCK